MSGRGAVIVFGHGIFSTGEDTFRPAFELLQTVEEACRREYFKKIRALI